MEIKVHAQAVTSLFDYIRGPPTTHAPVAVRIFINKRINYLLGSYFQSKKCRHWTQRDGAKIPLANNVTRTNRNIFYFAVFKGKR